MNLSKEIAFIKKYWKPILLVGFILFAIGSIKSCNDKNEQIRSLQAAKQFNDSAMNSQLTYWKDEAGRWHAEANDAIVSRFETVDVLDSVSQLLNIKPKQILSVSKTGTALNLDAGLKVDTTGYKKIPCTGGDSTYIASEYSLSYRDPWIKVWGNLNGVNDSIHVTGTDTLSRVDYWKRRWFLGAKTYYTDFSNTNPHIKVVSNKGLQIKEKEKKWNVSLSGTYGYPVRSIIFNKPDIFIGVSVGYSLFRF